MANLKKSMRSGKVTLGSWITIGHTAIAEIMARMGFDWLTIDMEHSAITLSEAQELIQVIELSGVAPLVRVGKNDPSLIKRVMDAGAHGVIVPMVNTAAEAVRAVAAVKYPPVGSRGVGLARAQGYGLDFESYKNRINRDSVVIVQIEHIDAVRNLEAILSVPGVDGFVVGPYDLSGSMGIPGRFTDPRMKNALTRIMKVAKKFDVARGFHAVPPDPGEARKKIREGYNFIAFSFDALMLGDAYRRGCAEIRKGIRK